MSYTVTESMVQQFGANYRILGQQRTSRLERWCQMEENIVGTSTTVERLGKTNVHQITSRHADTQYADTPHSRRWLDLADWAWADLVDKMDKIKMLADPTSPYLRLGINAHNRQKDMTIIAAARGSARLGSGGTQALPSGQKIAVGGAGLTLAKLMTAKEILDAAEVDEEMEDDGQSGGMEVKRVMVVTTKQLTNLLGTTEIKSADYNTVKALVQGDLDTFLGFKFVRSELLTKVGTDRHCIAWSKGCIALGKGMDLFTSINPMPGKNFSVQVYASQSYGSVRVEDEGVVEIACLES